MIAFLAIAASMLVAALAWIVVPLLRRDKAGVVDREAANLQILRDQLRELEADLASGTITSEHREQARRELEQRVLEETSTGSGGGTGVPAFAGAWTAAVAACIVPIAAALLYAMLGNHEAFFPAAAKKAEAAGQHDITPEKIAEMVAKLEARLVKEPDNAEGWVVLAHSYFRMNRIPDAIRAYDRAVTLVPDNAGLLADYADAVAAEQKTIEGKPLELVARALKIDPTQWKALALAGTAAFDRRDFKLAVEYWEKLKASLPPDSKMARSIDASIAEAKAAGGRALTAESRGSSETRTTTASNAAPTAPASTASSAARPATAAAAASIAGTVNLSAALRARAEPTDTVFVFARAAQGSRMPLAILRKQVKDLPASFSLDDSMAMSPDMKISGFAEVVVGARVSKSGSATPQSGDLEGFSPPVKLGASGVDVVIDRARP